MLRSLLMTVVALVQGVVSLIFRREQQQRALKAGDPAPGFSLPGSDGRTYRLQEFTGRSVVVLAWFPKAFTGG